MIKQVLIKSDQTDLELSVKSGNSDQTIQIQYYKLTEQTVSWICRCTLFIFSTPHVNMQHLHTTGTKHKDFFYKKVSDLGGTIMMFVVKQRRFFSSVLSTALLCCLLCLNTLSFSINREWELKNDLFECYKVQKRSLNGSSVFSLHQSDKWWKDQLTVSFFLNEWVFLVTFC